MMGLEYTYWQKSILDIIKSEPDPRKIYVYVDTLGGKGKSTFAKHLVMTKNALSLAGKSSDVKYALTEAIKDRDIDIVIWDLPRSVGNLVNYQSIEEVKNGMFFSGKYESTMTLFNTPHLFIFTNEIPDLDKLSKDRWVINEI